MNHKSSGVLLCLMCLVVGSLSLPIVLTPSSPVAWDDVLGINTQFEWFNESVVDTQIALYKQLGLTWVRRDIHWWYFEYYEDVKLWSSINYSFVASEAAGLHSLVYFVGTPPWAQNPPNTTTDAYPPGNPAVYAGRLVELAQRYPSVEYWEVWNEMNLLSFWQPNYDPAGYNALFQACVSAFATAGISHKLAVGGVAYYGNTITGGNMLTDLQALGTFASNPVVSYHPYTDNPEGSGGQQASDPYAFSASAAYLNNLLRTYGVTDVWATEWGWSSYPVSTIPGDQPVIGESGQADFTVKRAMLNLAMGFNRTFLFALSDLDSRAGERDQFYGLIRLNLTTKPVYSALKNLFAITGPTLAPFPTSSIITSGTINNIVAISFLKTTTKMIALYVTSNSTAANNTVGVQVNATARLHNVLTNQHVDLTPDGSGYVTLSVAYNMQILEWPVTPGAASTSTSTSSSASITTSAATSKSAASTTTTSAASSSASSVPVSTTTTGQNDSSASTVRLSVALILIYCCTLISYL